MNLSHLINTYGYWAVLYVVDILVVTALRSPVESSIDLA